MAPNRKKPRSASAVHALLLLGVPLLLLLVLLRLSSTTPSPYPYPFLHCSSSPSPSWSGDLRAAQFSWNHLRFDPGRPAPERLKIAVFSRKWPVDSSPGGMERHALTLHSALARRGHRVHVFTSSFAGNASAAAGSSPVLHPLSAPHWRPDEAWALFRAEHARGGFDAVHSESVALPSRLARSLPHLAVSWHGIALEGLYSNVYQELARGAGEPAGLDRALLDAPAKLVGEIRFFQEYAHHVAISDSAGEVLRDVYQVPRRRVHVVLNGVDEGQFRPDAALGARFRDEVGVPRNASVVMGVAGRLVKDKGHPLLHAAFANITSRFAGVYLLVAGTGPWASRYESLGKQVVTLGALPPTMLRAFYNSLDVFLNPTLRPQGLDLTLMEAMQCGKPVVATRFPSIKGSIVVNEELGHMFAPNVESLVEVLEEVVLEGRRRLEERGQACRRYAAEMFGATKMAMAYERLFLCIKNETYCKYPLWFD